MTLLVGLLFLVLWAAALYTGIVIFGRRYFGPGRVEAAATIATLAFVAGNALFPQHTSSNGSTAPARDVSARDAFPGTRAGSLVEPCSSISLPPANAGAAGSIDYIHDETTDQNVAEGATIQADQAFFIVGWAADVTDGTLARAVCVAVDGRLVRDQNVTYGLSRPDVAATLKTPFLSTAGFRIRIDANAVSPGHHHLDIVILNKSGSTSTLPQGRTIEVI